MADLHTLERDDVLVVRFTSPRVLSEVAIAQIGEELMGLVDQAEGKLLLDFSGVSFMSSAMVGKFMSLSKKCQSTKTNAKLCSISPKIKEVFNLTGLNKVFRIYDNEAAALAAFRKKGWFS